MLKGKTAVITGSSSGIGRAIALCFAREGANLVVTGRNQGRLSAVAAECRQEGALQPEQFTRVAFPCSRGVNRTRYLPESRSGLSKYASIRDEYIKQVLDIVADLSKTEEVQRLGENILGNFKEISVLVNNAASAVVCTFSETTLAEFDRVFNTNVRAPFMLSQALLPSLTKTEGCIINISSLTARNIFPKMLTYGMSKAALNHFTEALSFECSQKGVRVNTVSPATVKTGQLTGDGAENKLTPAEIDATMNFMATCQPLGTLNGIIAAEDIAKTVLFLASPSAGCITGQVITVDAGYNPYHAMTLL